MMEKTAGLKPEDEEKGILSDIEYWQEEETS